MIEPFLFSCINKSLVNGNLSSLVVGSRAFFLNLLMDMNGLLRLHVPDKTVLRMLKCVNG